MATNFDQELLQSYLSKIVETRKEKEMLECVEIGLVRKVAGMINTSLYRFTNKGLKVSTGHGDVRYWLVRADANVPKYSHEEIELVFCLICAPDDIKGNLRLTKKEKEVAAELQQIWDDSVKEYYLYNLGHYREASQKLLELTHHLRCYNEIHFSYNINDFYSKNNFLDQHYNFSELCEYEYGNISTRDLEDLNKLF